METSLNLGNANANSKLVNYYLDEGLIKGCVLMVNASKSVSLGINFGPMCKRQSVSQMVERKLCK